MPLERLAVLAAIQTAKHSHNNGNSTAEGDSSRQGSNTSNNGIGRAGRFDNDLDGNVHVFLGGAMMSGVIIVVVLMCYCCHRNMRKHRPQEYSQYCRAESDVHNLEVFTTHTMCHGEHIAAMNHEDETISIPCPSTLGPPPTYDSLIFNPQSLSSPSDKNNQSPIPDENIEAPKPSKFDEPAKSDETTKEIPIVEDNEGLPTYDVALKLEANGYV